jgi:aerobic-type carbon monoxide dehydrogenase small subunit (CoxS/CutS family)
MVEASMADARDGATVSRRGFLRGAGVATAGAAALDRLWPGAAAAAGEPNPTISGPDAVALTLKVNGAEQSLAVETRTTLAEALRGPLGLTGTKLSCERGACSACTVWLDGAPVLSCMTLAIDVGERAVTTIEGLAKGEALHPVQAEFIEQGALQCGYCTPGMIMSEAALLARNPHPSLDEVKAAVSGHVCRCGSYPRVFAATLAASEKKG